MPRRKFERYEFGPRLRQFRRDKGMTLVQLAEKAEINLTTLCYLEKDSRSVRLDTLVKLADALVLPIDELIGREPPEHEVAV